jgi:chaperonin GroEL (HSP60 family)
VIAEGYDLAKEELLKFLDTFKVSRPNVLDDRELLTSVARTSLRTKLAEEVGTLSRADSPLSAKSYVCACLLSGMQLADQMTEAVTDAVVTVTEPGKAIDLHMVEIMHMTHKLGTDSRFVRGLVSSALEPIDCRVCGLVLVHTCVFPRICRCLTTGPAIRTCPRHSRTASFSRAMCPLSTKRRESDVVL